MVIKEITNLSFLQEIIAENQKLSEKRKQLAQDIKLLLGAQKKEQLFIANQLSDLINSKVNEALLELNYLFKKSNNPTEEQLQHMDRAITMVRQVRDDIQMVSKRLQNPTDAI